MSEPPSTIYERYPWLWDCAEDYSNDPSTHRACVEVSRSRSKSHNK